MREFSLARKKPVEERSLSKMSANSMYSMRMAQMSLEAQGQSFAGRQQWLMKPEPLQQHGEMASLPSKATDELRGTSSVESSMKRANLCVKRNLIGRRSLERKPTSALSESPCDENDSVSCFPTLRGNVPDSQRAHERRADRGYVPQAMIHKMPAHNASNHEQPRTVTTKTAHREPRPQTSAVLVCQDLSEFDLCECHNSSVVAQQHGFLTEQDIPKLIEETGYSRIELYALWERFKALCSISKAPKGIDKDTFHRNLPQLSVEDNFFIDRVFIILDADGSGILEWQEFVEALSALEKGDINKRVGFLFRVYDLNGDGTIHRSEAMQFFLASLLVTANDEVEEVARHFINKIFAAVGCAHKDSMNIEDALVYMKEHPAADIYSLFGRTMVSTRQHSVVDTNSPGKLDPMAIIG
ncbi:Calcineurin b protein 10, partial [Globisporangium splendens]